MLVLLASIAPGRRAATLCGHKAQVAASNTTPLLCDLVPISPELLKILRYRYYGSAQPLFKNEKSEYPKKKAFGKSVRHLK